MGSEMCIRDSVTRGLLRGVLLNRDLMLAPKLRIVLPVTGLDADLGDTLVPDRIPDFGLVSLPLLINRSIYILTQHYYFGIFNSFTKTILFFLSSISP